MTVELKVFEEKMQKSVDNLGENFNSIRAGRANPHVLDKIKVDYYGTPTPLQQVGKHLVDLTIDKTQRVACIRS